MRMGDGEICSEMSQITVDSADQMVDDQGGATSSNLDHTAFELMPTEWTNEKHCLYLKFMEASFVKQLHYSMAMRHKRPLEANSSEQSKSLVDGSWKDVSKNKRGRKSEAVTESPALVASPRIRRFRRAVKQQEVEASTSQCVDQDIKSEKKTTIRSNNNSRQLAATLSRQDSVGSNTEMSDQNFV